MTPMATDNQPAWHEPTTGNQQAALLSPRFDLHSVLSTLGGWWCRFELTRYGQVEDGQRHSQPQSETRLPLVEIRKIGGDQIYLTMPSVFSVGRGATASSWRADVDSLGSWPRPRKPVAVYHSSTMLRSASRLPNGHALFSSLDSTRLRMTT